MPVLIMTGDHNVIAPHEHAVATQDLPLDVKTVVIPGDNNDITNNIAHLEVERLLSGFVAGHLAASHAASLVCDAGLGADGLAQRRHVSDIIPLYKRIPLTILFPSFESAA